MLKPILFLTLISASVATYGQTDSLTQRSGVKTLSLKQYDALQKGDDIYGLAAAAELNHYPQPDAVLRYKKEIDLSPQQMKELTAIATELTRKKKEMGVFIIRNERAIDSLFRTRKANDGNIIFYTNRYGIYQGEMRNAILQACISTQKLLTPKQITRFERLNYK